MTQNYFSIIWPLHFTELRMRKTGSVKKCLFCNKDFYVPLWKSRIGEGRFCSRVCTTKGKGPNSGYFQKGHAQLTFKDPSKHHVVSCPCGVKFEFRIITTQPRQYCSRECAYRYKGSNGPHSEETKRKIGVAYKK